MAGTAGRTTINIVDDIVENGEEYDFYQAVRLLNRLSDKNDNADSSIRKSLTIRPELNLDYPNADIESVTELGDNRYEILTTFFGLYGVSSPLPGYITEELLDEEWEERDSTRDFLDVIHQHMYPLLYRSWLKYRFSHNAIEDDGERYWEIIYSLLGLPEEFREFGDLSGQFLKYSGLIAQRPRTQLGLNTILSDYLAPINVDVIPCVERKVPIIKSQRCALSLQNHKLAENSILGEQVADRSGKYQIMIGPVSSEKFLELMNDKKHVRFVRSVADLYMVQPLDCEIVLKLEKGAAMSVTLGEKSFGLLGQSSWLVEQRNEFEFTVVLH